MIVRIIENVALTVYFFSTLVPHVCLVFSVRPLPGLTLTPASFSSSTSSSSSSSSLSSSSSPSIAALSSPVDRYSPELAIQNRYYFGTVHLLSFILMPQ